MDHLLLRNHFIRVQSAKSENTSAIPRTVVINMSFQGSRFLSRISLGNYFNEVYYNTTLLQFSPIFPDLQEPGDSKQF